MNIDINLIKVFRYLKRHSWLWKKSFHITKILIFRVYVDAESRRVIKYQEDPQKDFLMMKNQHQQVGIQNFSIVYLTLLLKVNIKAFMNVLKHYLWYRNMFSELDLKHDCITINTDNQVVMKPLTQNLNKSIENFTVLEN